MFFHSFSAFATRLISLAIRGRGLCNEEYYDSCGYYVVNHGADGDADEITFTSKETDYRCRCDYVMYADHIACRTAYGLLCYYPSGIQTQELDRLQPKLIQWRVFTYRAMKEVSIQAILRAALLGDER